MLEVYLEIELKNKMIDLLLENGVSSFYCFDGYKYALKEDLISEKEKVSGRKECALFKIFLEEKKNKKIIKLIKENIDSNKMEIF
ncbi:MULTISPECIES: DUF3240 family protein [unclassified Helicobacter]|uniref:DUF3240 family protein n=1 Tax=unclassified Helicobacter TaxID=2593540 RepID=UPI000CF0FAC3|nr:MULTISPECIES: DUF3240 family protein [unclassified Helicobacter]